jgi:hypothetical protein
MKSVRVIQNSICIGENKQYLYVGKINFLILSTKWPFPKKDVIYSENTSQLRKIDQKQEVSCNSCILQDQYWYQIW